MLAPIGGVGGAPVARGVVLVAAALLLFLELGLHLDALDQLQEASEGGQAGAAGQLTRTALRMR
jgi:hypothetical protein